MKKIGIIGGMSYESSIHYYERINDGINNILGGLYCGELIIYNVNFEEFRELMLNGEWDIIGNKLASIAKILENAGADYIAIATNTMHKVAEIVQENINIPLIHIGDSVSKKCKIDNIKKVLLLGTKYTMQDNFMKDRLKLNNLEVIVPDDINDINEIDRIIFDELCKGKIIKKSHDYYINVINKMIDKYHIEGVILGCTEIEMLINDKDTNIRVYDTTQSHIDDIINYSLGR